MWVCVSVLCVSVLCVSVLCVGMCKCAVWVCVCVLCVGMCKCAMCGYVYVCTLKTVISVNVRFTYVWLFGIRSLCVNGHDSYCISHKNADWKVCRLGH